MSKETLERFYTIPLKGAWATARNRRSNRAVRILREFAFKHMKAKEVRIAGEVSEHIWKRGIRSPPRHINVKMVKDEDDVVTVTLVEKISEKEASAEEVHPQQPSEPSRS